MLLKSCKRVDPIARTRARLVVLFGTLIVQVLLLPVVQYVWLRDNNGPVLTPADDYRLNWMSDAVYRGLDAATGPTYEVTEGNRHVIYAAGKTWKLFRPYYQETPDGQWHVQVLARGPMTPYAARSYAYPAVIAIVYSLIGLGICYYGLRPDRSDKMLE